MILNFCRHFFTSDKFFHILIPFLKKKTVDPFFALGKNQKGKLFVQDCNTHSLVPFLFEAQCTVRTYPFLFETEDFFSGSLPSTRIRSKRSPKTHLFENARRSGDFWKRHFGYQWMRMLPSKMVPSSVTIAFSTGRAKKIKKHNVWTRIVLKRRKKIPVFKQKRIHMTGLRHWWRQLCEKPKQDDWAIKKHCGLLYLNFHWILRVIVLWIKQLQTQTADILIFVLLKRIRTVTLLQ